MDRINIKGLTIPAKHGVLAEEKEACQRFTVSASLFLDLSRAGASDDLTQTIDYGRICGVIKSFVADNSFNLIETIAERLAGKLLAENTQLQRIRLEVGKPDAPIDADFKTVSVEIERSRHTAYVALGSNIGDREAHLRFGLERLRKAQGCRIISTSSMINTAPHGYTEQDDFLNACVEIETFLTPHELLGLLQSIEKDAGRKRTARWRPRTLDLDIIFYDDAVMSDSRLRIPHAEMHKRDFVLKPLCEIAPYKLHPVLLKTASELLDMLN